MYIKELGIDEQAEIEYQVIADTSSEPGLYKLDLQLDYFDSSLSQNTLSSVAGVFVGGITDFKVEFTEFREKKSYFSIANIGNNPAYSVSLTIPIQENWKIKGSHSLMIGNLNHGDYTLSGFELYSVEAAPLLVEISYTDTMGNRQKLEKAIILDTESIPEELTSPVDNGFSSFHIIMIIFVVIVSMILIRWLKK